MRICSREEFYKLPNGVPFVKENCIEFVGKIEDYCGAIFIHNDLVDYDGNRFLVLEKSDWEKIKNVVEKAYE